MNLSVYSLQKTLFEGAVEKVIAQTPEGQITILSNHIPLITRLNGPAVVAVDDAGKKQEILLAGGIMEVRPGSEVVVLASDK